jgi:hypothetical protein
MSSGAALYQWCPFHVWLNSGTFEVRSWDNSSGFKGQKGNTTAAVSAQVLAEKRTTASEWRGEQLTIVYTLTVWQRCTGTLCTV